MNPGDCPECDGIGEVWNGEREHDTGAYVTFDCVACDGTGRA